MKKRYIFGSAALALLATITLAACGSKTSSQGLERISRQRLPLLTKNGYALQRNVEEVYCSIQQRISEYHR